MDFKNTRISTRLALGFGLMALIIVCMGAFSLLRIASVEAAFYLVIDDRYAKIARLHEVKDDVNLIARNMRNMLLVATPAEVKSQLDELMAARARAGAALKEIRAQMTHPQGQTLIASAEEAREKFVALQNRFLALVAANQTAQARALLMTEARAAQRDYFAKADAVIAFQRELMTQAAQDMHATITSLRWMLMAAAAGAMVLAAALAWGTIRSIARPLQRAVSVARAVAGGDLSQPIEEGGHNEMGHLLAALKAMQDSLAGVVTNVRQNADSVATASSQISQGNNDLSSRTEEQASALQQTAASMKQLSSTVRQNADNARQGNELALGASTVAARGGEVVGQVVETMKGINESSRKIADIISVIDGIAFQTNILALNAAVEAARAGEQGRGFAVVASEVRSLAGRSAEAAKEIKTLISASVERVEHGTSLVDKAGSTMTEVVASIRRVTDIMGEISAASNEQASGVAQVGEAVSQMDQATQQNAALVEQMAAAASSLKSQANELVQTVATFKLEAGAHSAGLPAAKVRSVTPPAPTPAVSPRRVAGSSQGATARTPAAPAKPAALPTPAAPKTQSKPAPAGGDDEWETF